MIIPEVDYERDVSVNLPIISSLFADGMLIYVVEFKFESIAERLNDQIVRICEEQGNRYVRSCSWTYSNWIRQSRPNSSLHKQGFTQGTCSLQ